MAKTNVGQFDSTAANNTDVDSVSVAEGMAPSGVNNALRATMAMIAEWADDHKGYTATGTDTYAVATTGTHFASPAALADIHGLVVTFTNANTGAATLNVDSLGATAIKKNGGQALVSGDIPAGGTFYLTYDGTDFEIVGKIGSADSSPDALITTRGDLIYGNSSAAAARLAVGGASTVLVSDGTDPSWGNINNAHWSGTDLSVANGGTGASTAADAFTALKQAASDTATGVIEIAIQSEMETGTDATLAVTPGRQHFHQSAAKAWGCIERGAGTPSLDSPSYNVNSVADTGSAGQTTVTIETDFGDADYVLAGNPTGTASGRMVVFTSRAVGSFVMAILVHDGTQQDTDDYCFVAFGDI